MLAWVVRYPVVGTFYATTDVDLLRPHEADETGGTVCAHDWERDGQTLLSVWWTCTKCGKTMLC